MNTRLKYIDNWQQLAEQANWSASDLAKICGISLRTLDRHFKTMTGQTPKIWLAEHRQHRAVELLKQGCSIKEAASTLGYDHPHNFSRKFKKFWGYCPSKQSGGFTG